MLLQICAGCATCNTAKHNMSNYSADMLSAAADLCWLLHLSSAKHNICNYSADMLSAAADMCWLLHLSSANRHRLRVIVVLTDV